MPIVRLPQNAFSGGILIEDRMRGRYDSKIYAEGARSLYNVVSHPQGGVFRRYGTKFMSDYTSKYSIGGKFRIIKFDYSDDLNYLLVFYNDKIDVFKNDILVHTIVGTGINPTILSQMDHVQKANALFLVHGDMPPKQLSRGASDTSWTLSDIVFNPAPLYAFTLTTSTPSTTVTPSAISGNIKLTSGAAVFSSSDVGGYVTGNGGEARITKFISNTVVEARVTLNFVDTSAIVSGQWELENGYVDAWSASKGYPRSVVYHDDSLLFGGTKSLPDVWWKSAIADYFNNDDTKALPDSAMSANVKSNNINDIRFMVSGDDLVILTSESEFYVDGVMTPDLEFTVRKQEERGCREYIKPVFVDGAPMYIDARSDVLRELTYNDVDGKYSSTNLSFFCPGLIKDPIQIAHQKPNSKIDNDYVWIVNSDGTWVVYNTLRKISVNAFVQAASREDKMLNCAEINGYVYAVFERDINGATKYYLEKFDSSCYMDCSLVYSGSPVSVISGLSFLNGETVQIVTDGKLHRDLVVSSGQVTLDGEYSDVQIGFDFPIVVETLPPSNQLPDGTSIGEIRRIVAVTLGLSGVSDIEVNGHPVRNRRFGQTLFDDPPPLISGRKRVTLRGGYSRDPVVRITQNVPLPFHLTDVILEVQV